VEQQKLVEVFNDFKKKFMIIYNEKAHKYNAEEFLDGIEQKTTQNLELNHEKNHLLVERDGLVVKLNEGEFKYYVIPMKSFFIIISLKLE
jgi:hypothetical protein